MWPSKTCLNKTLTIIGAHLIMTPLTIYWSFGNFSPYLESYTRFSPDYGHGTRAYTEWTIAFLVAMETVGIFLGQSLVKRLGFRWTNVINTIVCALSLILSAWAIEKCLLLSIVFLGVIPGTCSGICLTVCYILIEQWAPESYSLIIASVTGFPSYLVMLVNPMITVYVNPNNLEPDAYVGQTAYFSQPGLLERVPGIFLLLAVIIGTPQAIGCFLIKPKPALSCEANVIPQENEIVNDSENCKIVQTALSKPFYSEGANQVSSECQRNTNNVETFNGNTSNESGHSPPTSDEDTSHQRLIIPESKPDSKTLSEALRTRVFWVIWVASCLITLGSLLINDYYKLFGLVYIPDDKFLALVGTLMTILSPLFRIVAGWCIDKDIFNVKDTCIMMLSVNTVLSGYWYLSAQVDRFFYLVLVITLNGFMNINFIMVPTAGLRLFGPDHFSRIAGALYSGTLMLTILFPVGMTSIIAIGWFGVFTSFAVLSLLVLLLVALTRFVEIYKTSKVK